MATNKTGRNIGALGNPRDTDPVPPVEPPVEPPVPPVESVPPVEPVVPPVVPPVPPVVPPVVEPPVEPPVAPALYITPTPQPPLQPPVEAGAMGAQDNQLLSRISQLEEQLNASKIEAERADLFNVVIPDDAEDAELMRSMYDTVTRPALERVNEYWATQFEKVQQSSADNTSNINTVSTEVTRQMEQDRIARTNQTILSEIPKFKDMMADSEFLKKAEAVIPGTQTSYMEQLSSAYNDGNASYVVEVANYLDKLGNQPAEVAEPMLGGQAGGQPAGNQSEFQYTHSDLTDMKQKYMRKEINVAEFREFTAKFDTAMQEGRVKF